MTPALPIRVAVTGSSGVLGSRLVERLLGFGCHVDGLDVRPAPRRPGFHPHAVDVRDYAGVLRALSESDAAVHCAAALPSYPAAQIRSVIVDGTETVLGAARRAGLDRVVHISSTAVYGLPTTVPTPEEYPRQPVDPYSRAKAEAETIVEHHRALGCCVPVLRPKTFLGPGRLGLFSMLFQWADEGRNFPVLGRGDVRIQMLDLDDLVEAVLVALRVPEPAASDTYNVAASRFGTLREDFQAVLDAAGHGGRIVSVPAGPSIGVLRLLERSGLSPVYGRLLAKLRSDSYVAIDKVSERLGFRPERSNREAILRTYTWWQQNPASAVPGGGRTSSRPWRQGALGLARFLF